MPPRARKKKDHAGERKENDPKKQTDVSEGPEEETDKELEEEIRRMDQEVARRAKAREQQAALARGEKVSSRGVGPDGKPLPFTQLERLKTAVVIGGVFSLLYQYTDWFDQISWPLAYIAIWTPLLLLVMKNMNPDDMIKDLKGPLGRPDGANGGDLGPEIVDKKKQ